jgi:hypothetical protein
MELPDTGFACFALHKKSEVKKAVVHIQRILMQLSVERVV